MKRLLLASLLLILPLTHAQVSPPDVMNYQGVLRDNNDAPIDGSVGMVFRFFDALTGGNELLVDTHAAVTVDGGLFNVAMGGGSISGTYSSLSALFQSENAVWLEVQIQSETLTPRTPLRSAPYALNSKTLEGSTLGDIGATINATVGVHQMDSAAHHTRYADAEAIAAMGTTTDGNPLNHTKRSDAEIVSAILASGMVPIDVTGGTANGFDVEDLFGNVWDGIQRPAATYTVAESTCSNLGARLPTPSELFRLNASTGSGNLSDTSASAPLWTLIESASLDHRVTVRLSDGVATSTSAASTAAYRCIWPETLPLGFDGDKCNGGCSAFGLDWNIDAQDRLALDYAAASNECAFYGLSLPTVREFGESIRAGLPSGSNSWLWADDAKYWHANNYGNSLVRWAGNGDPNWSWRNSPDSLGSFSFPTSAFNFRCIGKRSPSIGELPALPACEGGCFQSTEGATQIYADSSNRVAATHAVAASTCNAAGGALPYISDMTQLIHEGLPGGTGSLLWSADPAYWYNGNFGYSLFSFSGTGDPSWIPSSSFHGVGIATSSFAYRCVWQESFEPTPTECGPAEEQIWNGSSFDCQASTDGTSAGAASPLEVLDAWGNAWDVIERSAATYSDATAVCDGAGGRLPTATELYRVRNGQSIAPSIGSGIDYLWTSAITPSDNQRTALRLSDGATSNVPESSSRPYRCIWPASQGDVMAGRACYGDPLTSCSQVNGMRIDRYDRPELTFPGAAAECTASGGRLPDAGEMQHLIQSGIPNGSNNWLWMDESIYWFSGGYGQAIGRWSGAGPSDWSYSSPAYGSLSFPTSSYGFRCIYSDRLD